jgi:hypothetical protein
MKSRYAQYRPGRTPRKRFLRTAELSVVGWGALLLACAVMAAAGHFAGRWLGWPGGPAAALGAAAVVAAVVIADRRRWNALEGVVSWTHDEDEVERVASGLRERGVDVGVQMGRDVPGLLYTNRQRAEVRAALDEIGVEMPHW